MIREAIPTVVVGINISPSEDSEKNAVLFDKLLDLLCIDTPIPTTDVFNDIGICSAMTYEDIGNISVLRDFVWNWRGKNEGDSYTPFCTYLNNITKDGVQEFYCYVVSNGQRLNDAFLFDHDIITLRSMDPLGNKKQLVYRGHVRGRTDLVVTRYEALGNISRHMLRFVIEVKTAEEMRTKLSNCIRAAATQVIGLCVDNCNNSPCVILTDFTSSFYVLYLCISQHSSPAQLKYDIVVQTCGSILSVLNKACEMSLFCISHDFCRPTTPEEYLV